MSDKPPPIRFNFEWEIDFLFVKYGLWHIATPRNASAESLLMVGGSLTGSMKTPNLHRSFGRFLMLACLLVERCSCWRALNSSADHIMDEGDDEVNLQVTPANDLRRSYHLWFRILNLCSSSLPLKILHEYSLWKLLEDVWIYVASFRRELGIYAALSFVVSLISMAPPYFIAKVIDNLTKYGLFHSLLDDVLPK